MAKNEQTRLTWLCLFNMIKDELTKIDYMFKKPRWKLLNKFPAIPRSNLFFFFSLPFHKSYLFKIYSFTAFCKNMFLEQLLTFTQINPIISLKCTHFLRCRKGRWCYATCTSWLLLLLHWCKEAELWFQRLQDDYKFCPDSQDAEKASNLKYNQLISGLVTSGVWWLK